MVPIIHLMDRIPSVKHSNLFSIVPNKINNFTIFDRSFLMPK
jgi:hypothetical protein